MTLSEVVAKLPSLEDDCVIVCQGGPDWTPESAADLVWVDEFAESTDDLPMPDYFLEVWLAKEVIKVWAEWRDGLQPTHQERCEALIYYARNDAYVPRENN